MVSGHGRAGAARTVGHNFQGMATPAVKALPRHAQRMRRKRLEERILKTTVLRPDQDVVQIEFHPLHVRRVRHRRLDRVRFIRAARHLLHFHVCNLRRVRAGRRRLEVNPIAIRLVAGLVRGKGANAVRRPRLETGEVHVPAGLQTGSVQAGRGIAVEAVFQPARRRLIGLPVNSSRRFPHVGRRRTADNFRDDQIARPESGIGVVSFIAFFHRVKFVYLHTHINTHCPTVPGLAKEPGAHAPARDRLRDRRARLVFRSKVEAHTVPGRRFVHPLVTHNVTDDALVSVIPRFARHQIRQRRRRNHLNRQVAHKCRATILGRYRNLLATHRVPAPRHFAHTFATALLHRRLPRPLPRKRNWRVRICRPDRGAERIRPARRPTRRPVQAQVRQRRFARRRRFLNCHRVRIRHAPTTILQGQADHLLPGRGPTVSRRRVVGRRLVRSLPRISERLRRPDRAHRRAKRVIAVRLTGRRAVDRHPRHRRTRRWRRLILHRQPRARRAVAAIPVERPSFDPRFRRQHNPVVGHRPLNPPLHDIRHVEMLPPHRVIHGRVAQVAARRPVVPGNTRLRPTAQNRLRLHRQDVRRRLRLPQIDLRVKAQRRRNHHDLVRQAAGVKGDQRVILVSFRVPPDPEV